jgi:hypothetical protein
LVLVELPAAGIRDDNLDRVADTCPLTGLDRERPDIRTCPLAAGSLR